MMTFLLNIMTVIYSSVSFVVERHFARRYVNREYLNPVPKRLRNIRPEFTVQRRNSAFLNFVNESFIVLYYFVLFLIFFPLSQSFSLSFFLSLLFFSFSFFSFSFLLILMSYFNSTILILLQCFRH